MDEKQPVRSSRDRTERANHANDVRLRLMDADGEKLLRALHNHKMVGVLSKNEVMYVFLFRGAYQCFIHAFDAEEGRHRAFPVSERTKAMMKNLPAAADGLFEITPKPDMDPMGVMAAAERGILSYLDMTGQLPAEDVDFMQWLEKAKEDEV